MNIDDLTFGQIKQLKAIFGGSSCQEKPPFEIGEKYFICTVARYYLGECVACSDKFVTLQKCSWIAHTGRFHQFIKDGKLDEVEPFISDENINIAIGALIEFSRWHHNLPTEQK